MLLEPLDLVRESEARPFDSEVSDAHGSRVSDARIFYLHGRRPRGCPTYHYVEPDGVPSTGSVGLTGPDGKVYGPWQATGSDGQGGIKNAMWAATIDLVLTPGTYTVTDSDSSTWSSNDGTGGAGMFWIVGYPRS